MTIPIEQLRLPSRVYHSLKAGGIHTVEQVLQSRDSELLKLRQLGVRSLQILKDRLRRRGIRRDPAETEAAKEVDLTVRMGMPIDQAGFSDDLVERLHLAQIERLGELVSKRPNQLLRFPSLGRRSIQVVRKVLNDLGLDLGMDFVPLDDAGEKWMDRIDAARLKLAQWLTTDADIYFFARHYRLSHKTMTRLLRNQPTSVYESAKLRKVFAEKVDWQKKFDKQDGKAYKQIVGAEASYRQAGSLKSAAKKLGLSHERVRQMLKLGDALGLFEYRPEPAIGGTLRSSRNR